MTHTLPDYSTKYKLSKIFSGIDTLELAARLNSLSTMDRRGNLVWCDDFESAAAVKWVPVAAGAGTVALSTDRAWRSNQSMKTVTDATAGDSAYIGKRFCLPIERRIAAEIMFCMTAEKPIVQLDIIGYTGTKYFGAQVKYDHNLEKLYYYNSAGGWTELSLHDNTTIILESWLYMKLVIDWDTKKYSHFIFCGTEYDLSDESIWSMNSADLRSVEIYIRNIAGSNAAAIVYFDNFILTQNEP